MTKLKALGNPDADPSTGLETFPGISGTKVTLNCTEFTCRCPITHQPDWAKIKIDYVARYKIVESKSMKLYLELYRDEGIFHEHLAQRILDDLVKALEPLECSVTVNFNTRGGIAISATATYDPREG